MTNQVLKFFFPPSQPVAFVVNLLIATIFLVSLLVLLRSGYLRIRRERQYLRILKRAIQHENEDENLVDVAERFEDRAITRERIESLRTLKQAGDEIDHEAMAAIAISRLENSVRLASWSSYGVVLLGFAGTLVGLTRSVEGASRSLRELGEATTINQATEPLLETLDGIHVAFSTTLAGVLAALVLGGLLSAVQRYQTDFLTDFEQFTQNRLIPRYRTSAGVALVRTAQKLTELEEHLDHSLRQIIQELETRGGALVSAIEERFQNLVDSFEKSSTAHLDHIQSLLEKMDQYLGEDPDAVPSLSDSLGILNDASTIIRGDIEEYRKAFMDFGTAMEEVSEEYGSLFNESIQNQARSLEANLDRLEAIVSRGYEDTDSSLERLEFIVERIEAQEVTGSRVVESLGGVAQELRTAVDRMKQAILIHHETAEQLMSALGRQSYLGPVTRARRVETGGENKVLSGGGRSIPTEDDDANGRTEELASDDQEARSAGGESGQDGEGAQKRNARSPRSLFERLIRRDRG